MPTYDYVCNECSYNFEEFQSITAEPLETCPKCQGKVRRLIGTGNGFLFKGSGFYITDYRSEGYKKDKNKAEGKSSTTKETKTSTETKKKTESKAVA